MKKIKMSGCLIMLLILFNSVLLYTNSVNAASLSYHNLVQRELEYFPYSIIYQNNSFDGYEKYMKAVDNIGDYPMNSYDNLMDCYRKILLNDINNKSLLFGNKTIAEKLIADIQESLQVISIKYEKITPLSIASFEWYEMANREIIGANEYLKKSKEYYIEKNYDSALIQLLIANSSIHKADGFLYMAEEKNKNNNPIDFLIIEKTLEYVSSRWIEITENFIDFHEDMGHHNATIHPRQLLNQSRNLYENKIFYESLMTCAYAKAIMEYYLTENNYANYSQRITLGDTYLGYVAINMNKIYNNIDIDAPYAETTIELSKLHLQNAKDEDDEDLAIVISSLSTQESFIALEQARAVLDLKNSILNSALKVNEINHDEQTNAESEEINILLILVILVCILLIVLIYNFSKKYLKIGDKR